MEFKSFPDIKKLSSTQFSITQKLHGSNAQLLVYPDESGTMQLLTGSRTRWIVPGDDNYNFAQFVYANKEEFITKLGPGQHFGEWCGAGINSGEGLKEKILVLFDYWRYDPNNLPLQTRLVPVLYNGDFDLSVIKNVMDDLKTNGSKLVPGFMHPEGIVVQINGFRYKVVFKAEETQWKRSDKVKLPKLEGVDFSHLLQPIRLEKLLSKDERYTINYPTSLKQIAFDYFDDLVKEGQVVGTEQEIGGIKKQCLSWIFSFIKETFKEKDSL